ncbi:MAG: AAA family ATPase [Actinomycetota bacterium]
MQRLMHLRSISMKGFKSFPGRTKLEFSPGVAVVVGPNGSGKSNITDAVLWALGEQSPLAVRGQTMKDVIFAGGHGVKGSNAAEVEVVIDNSSGRSDSEFAEISIVRRLDRSGEGEYRLNGARCRLADVAEVLSDTGLGKEMHSVVSQGRVESIVLSRPRERRILIEEAAGLGKHRRRRRRAQLKLERTEENLSRALDLEREARSRLRPLKRQAEAAQLHERIQRQSDEARHEFARDDVRGARASLESAEAESVAARSQRDECERLLAAVAARREQAEEAFAALSREREGLQGRLYASRSAHDRIGMRLERARDQARAAADGADRRASQLELVEGELAASGDGSTDRPDRIAALESELTALESARETRVREGLEGLQEEREQAEARRSELDEVSAALREALRAADASSEAARRARGTAERTAEGARASAARAGAELASVNEFLRSASSAGAHSASLSDVLEIQPGYEAAFAAALGPRLGAAVAEGREQAERLLDAAGDDGGVVLISGGGEHGAGSGEAGAPCEGAERLLDHVEASDAAARAVAGRLLAETWVVESLADVPAGFGGVAVTRAGRIYAPRAQELRQAAAGGPERVLEQRNRRSELVSASEAAARDEAEARAAVEAANADVTAADQAHEEAEVALRRAMREVEEAAEAVRRADWLIQRRSDAPDEGPDAVRRAELTAEVRAERQMEENEGRDRAQRTERAARLRRRIERDRALAAAADGASEALAGAREAVQARVAALEAEHALGARAGEETAAALRACAHEEAEIQGRLRAAAEHVTAAEVGAQQVRDAAADAQTALDEVAGRLGLEAEPAADALDDARREELQATIERLARRREQLGPVNPLAAAEYDEAVAHLEELESQRSDLERALTELRGLIRATDRRIQESFDETFAAAAKNFEDVVAHLFPGGRGRLRLADPDQGPRPVIGGAEHEPGEDDGDESEQSENAGRPSASEPGVEVEVTPAGKSTKRLSLLSGGEKSLVALAFMFAVFLARPCPFYILDEVEAALDDLNIDRFLQLLRRYSDRAQFIVVTHQKRTMDAADCLYGVSMGGDGISRVVSRRLSGEASAGIEAVA